jgi:hypothetical protein
MFLFQQLDQAPENGDRDTAGGEGAHKADDVAPEMVSVLFSCLLGLKLKSQQGFHQFFSGSESIAGKVAAGSQNDLV